MLIRTYGEFWSPDLVDWGKKGRGNKGQLLGVVLPNGKKQGSFKVDMWEATAIYCLYLDYRPVYIGKADGRLGGRLREHQKDRHVGRWDMFSFYSLSKANKGSGTAGKAGTRYLAPDTILDTVEAVSIRIFDPPLNRKHEQIPNADPIEQDTEDEPRPIRGYLEEILKKLE